MVLTVVIPTFNRIEHLNNQLKSLISQKYTDFKIVVLDNNSPYEISDIILAKNIKIIRNTTNIGASANILRAFEVCETKWLWILGDDDDIANDSIERIHAEIQNHNDAAIINFSNTFIERNKTSITYNQKDFINNIDNYSGILLISSTVYNINKVIKHTYEAYRLTISMASQVIVMLLSSENEKCVFSPIKTTQTSPENTKPRWSLFDYSLNSFLLFDLPISDENKSCLFRKINDYLPKFESFCIRIVFSDSILTPKQRHYMLINCYFRRLYYKFNLINLFLLLYILLCIRFKLFNNLTKKILLKLFPKKITNLSFLNDHK